MYRRPGILVLFISIFFPFEIYCQVAQSSPILMLHADLSDQNTGAFQKEFLSRRIRISQGPEKSAGWLLLTGNSSVPFTGPVARFKYQLPVTVINHEFQVGCRKSV